MKYLFPFLLNGGLAVVAIIWLYTTSAGLQALGVIFIMLLLGVCLNALLTIIFFVRREVRVGMLYGAFLVGIIGLFLAIMLQDTHGKMVNG